MLKKTAEISAVFRDLKTKEEFQKKHKVGKNSFTRKRKLGFDKIMTMIIKKSNKSLQNSLNDMQLDLKEDCTITNSAYTQARAKLNYTAFKEFATMSAEIFYKDDEYAKYKGFRLLAIDGSVIILPNSDDIKKEFNPTINKCQIDGWKKETIQARVSVLFDVENNIAIDSIIANKNRNDKNKLIAYDERTLASQHLSHCNMQDLVVMDRGYPSYELFALSHLKTNLLFRIRRNSFQEASSLFAAHCEKKDVILEIKAPKHLRESLREQNLPTMIKIRFVQVVLNNGEVEVLATNVLDNAILQTSDFKELYSKRWGIETYYDLIKNRLGLENFTGLTALSVKQDFYATIFLTNYESAMTYDLNEELKESTQDNKYVQKVNKSISFNVIKHKVFDLFYGNKPLDVMLKHMEKLFLTNTITIRPNRKSKPRLDKEKQKSTIAINSINYLKRKKKNVGN
ncbi:MAG: IS4 family transposase [Epsilonproteobacteria bacterium]|nr:IS4 family transposase [Campylobacterota bacterium]